MFHKLPLVLAVGAAMVTLAGVTPEFDGDTLLPGIAVLADCETAQSPTNDTESINCTTPRSNTVVWRIDRPNVQQKQTTYPAIRFAQGDLVSVFAGGCVQHGGSGLTWKRYVNPMSPERNNDDSYHGLISVPGYSSLGHIRDAVLQGGIAVLADPGEAAALSLGYVDDGYSDNGYSRRDDGWWRQCVDLPDAWVVIAIQHGCAASISPDCIRGRALDLVVDSRDDNGFPINPDWVWRRVTGTHPSASNVCSWSNKIGGFPVDDASLCVSQLTSRDYSGVCVQGGTAGGIAGHMNWTSTPVSYQGWIWWGSHDYYWDDDYTLNMAALHPSGGVSGALFLEGQSNPQVEFSSDETIDKFGGVPWWDLLHGAVDREDQRKHTANAVVAGAITPAELFPGGGEAIVIGQLGLDCAHACNSEMHPAWAVFVHTKDDPNDDTWSFFVRNWGNEGFCSTNDHRVSTRQMTVRLPRLGAVDVQLVVPQTVVGATKPTSPYSVAIAPGGGAAVATFPLPPADQHGVVFGELHLKWRRKLSTEMLATLAKPVDREMLSSLRPRRDLAQASQGAEELLTQRLKASTGMSKESQLLVRRPAAPQRWRRLQGRVARVSPAPPVPEAPLIRSVVVRPDALTQRRAKAALSLTQQ